MLEKLRTLFDTAIPFNQFLGLKLETLEPGRAQMRMAYKKELVGDFVRGSLHGGSAAGLMDTCGGIAAWSVLPDLTWRVATIDLDLGYMRRMILTDLLCEAHVVYHGSNIIRVDITAWPEGSKDKPSVIGRGTFAVHKVNPEVLQKFNASKAGAQSSAPPSKGPGEP